VFTVEPKILIQINPAIVGATLSAVFFVTAAISHSPEPSQNQAKIPDFKAFRAVIEKDCGKCHFGDDPIGGVRLDEAKGSADVLKNRALWDRVVQVVEGGIMPPKKQPQPTPKEKQLILSWLAATFAGDHDSANAGRVTMRRMNRLEYNNTVRDLTGLDLHLADDFPSDDVGYGFDNIGDVLSISPLLMEKYLSAAETIASKLIIVPTASPLDIDPGEMRIEGAGRRGPTGDIGFYSSGSAIIDYDCTRPGLHKIKVKASADQAGPDLAKMEISLDGKLIRQVDVRAVTGKPEVIEVPMEIDAGKHHLQFAFVNDFYEAGPPQKDRNLNVGSVTIVRPSIKWANAPTAEKAIIYEQPLSPPNEKQARAMLKRFANRAFRRPATTNELDRLVALSKTAWKKGESFERGIQLGVQATLSSPNFLFRVETDTGVPRLGSYELASRLSYFIWSSMPDDKLLGVAATGQLEQPDVLQREARRMLADPRAEALDEAFAAQWLNLRKLNSVNPDPAQFPDWNEGLRKSMMTETRMFFANVVHEDRPITDFIDAKYTFVDERLGKLYGLPGVTGAGFRKVSLEGTPRAGLLTQASILTLTSNPTRTSPVKRGKWVLDQLLNQPPPPQPPGVPDLKETEKAAPEAKTLREKMARHLKDPVCASCHTRMDPVGFSLENFDGIGRWRDKDGETTIDASGELPGGDKFDGPVGLRSILDRKTSEFTEAFSVKLLTFAIGRGIESSDQLYVDEIANKAQKGKYRFSAVVDAVVSSEPFRLRREKKGH
jgi:hypothetical protein